MKHRLLAVALAVVSALAVSSCGDRGGDVPPRSSDEMLMQCMARRDHVAALRHLVTSLEAPSDTTFEALQTVALTYAELDRLAWTLWNASRQWIAMKSEQPGLLLARPHLAALDSIDLAFRELDAGNPVRLNFPLEDDWSVDIGPAESFITDWNEEGSILRDLWRAGDPSTPATVRQATLERALGDTTAWGDDPAEWRWVWGRAMLAEALARSGRSAEALTVLDSIRQSPGDVAILVDEAEHRSRYGFPALGHLAVMSRAYHLIFADVASRLAGKVSAEKLGTEAWATYARWQADRSRKLDERLDLHPGTPSDLSLPGDEDWSQQSTSYHAAALFAGRVDPLVSRRILRERLPEFLAVLGMVSARNRIGETPSARNDTSATMHLFKLGASFRSETSASVEAEGALCVAIWTHRLINRWNYQTATNHLLELVGHGYPVAALSRFAAFTQAVISA